ncbi:MAG: cupredoxin domain-containing protein [Euryarchaeota archaeon]|nr:cupredoxin domain-containing protein [Euryarchaeota archaeon]
MQLKSLTVIVVLSLSVASLLVAGCTTSTNDQTPSASPVTSTASQNTVVIHNYTFSPASLTIQKGANVIWRNNDSVDHELYSESPIFSSPKVGAGGSSPLIGAGGTYTYQFNTTGTYPYRCFIHSQETGAIIVQ